MDPLWEQLELHYVRRRPAFRAWKRWLSGGCTVIAAAWALAAVVGRDATVLSSGPMSRGHAHLANRCAACHTQPWRTASDLISEAANTRAMNEACLACHRKSIGHDATTASAWHPLADTMETSDRATVACYRCHVEHEGPIVLREVDDSGCVRCHANLGPHRASGAKERFASSVSAFAADHPEFDVLADRTPDATRMLLNHAKHLDPTAFTDRTQMICGDCHRAGVSTAPWRFGAPRTHENPQTMISPTEPELQGDFMSPIRYSLHCRNCHSLAVDGERKRLNAAGHVPHDEPRAVRTFLWGALTEYINAHPQELDQPAEPPDRRHLPFGEPRAKPDEELDRRKIEWVDRERRILEAQLFDTKLFCRKCHEIRETPDDLGLPVILPPDIPSRWFDHASFSHERHRTMECAECHPKALTSKETKDVLLPGIDVCRKCHAPFGLAPTTGASDRCVLCHTYHVPASPTGTADAATPSERIEPTP